MKPKITGWLKIKGAFRNWRPFSSNVDLSNDPERYASDPWRRNQSGNCYSIHRIRIRFRWPSFADSLEDAPAERIVEPLAKLIAHASVSDPDPGTCPENLILKSTTGDEERQYMKEVRRVGTHAQLQGTIIVLTHIVAENRIVVYNINF